VDFCARYGLPTPQVNATVCGLEVDAYFADAKVIVELDSWEYHSDRAAFETDRERDAITSAAGHVTVRITHERLDTAPDAEAARLRQIIAARATAAAPEARRQARRRRAR
jgi:very-short-patch-repair endonuclease